MAADAVDPFRVAPVDPEGQTSQSRRSGPDDPHVRDLAVVGQRAAHQRQQVDAVGTLDRAAFPDATH